MVAITHFIQDTDVRLGGVVSTVTDTCNYLAEAGHDVALATDGSPNGLCPSVNVVTSSEAIAAGNGVWHLHTPWALKNLSIARTARAKDIPYVVSIHGMLDDWSMAQKPLKKKIFLTLFGKSLLRGASAVHFTARKEQEQVISRLPFLRSSAYIAPCLVDLGPLLDMELKKSKPPKILFLSRLHHKKGPDVLLRAYKTVSLHRPDCKLVIAGPGEPNYVRHLEAFSLKLDVSDRVSFTGMVQGEEKRRLFQEASVFVLPTQQENFGIVLTEAMAAGLPIITTDKTDIWEELKEGGATITDGSASQIAKGVLNILNLDSATSEKIRLTGRRYVEQWLDPEKVTNRYVDMYTQCLTK